MLLVKMHQRHMLEWTGAEDAHTREGDDLDSEERIGPHGNQVAVITLFECLLVSSYGLELRDVRSLLVSTPAA